MRHAAVVAQLLRSREPSVRWMTRVGVLRQRRSSPTVRSLERSIRTSPRVRALLHGCDPRTGTRSARIIYNKWQGAHWVFGSLADLVYPPGDARLAGLRDRVLDKWTQPLYDTTIEVRSAGASYGFDGVPRIDGRYRRCASVQGNALRSALALGLADERADRLAAWLLRWQWPDGGWNCDRNPSAHVSSFHESLLPMVALSEYARWRSSSQAAQAAKRASEVFLERRLFRRRSNAQPMWPDLLRLHFPRYWHYDLLGGLWAMARIGAIGDPRCQEGLDWLESRELPSGGWPADAKYYVRPPGSRGSALESVDWGGSSKVRPNEWVTAQALSVLADAGRAGT